MTKPKQRDGKKNKGRGGAARGSEEVEPDEIDMAFNQTLDGFDFNTAVYIAGKGWIQQDKWMEMVKGMFS